MVRAILEGRKTQTRRIVKHSDPIVLSETNAICSDGLNWIFWVGAKNPRTKQQYDELTKQLFAPGEGIKCPYGRPGDHLWVRETFYAYGAWRIRYSDKKRRNEWYFDDLTIEYGENYRYSENAPDYIEGRLLDVLNWHKRPSIHMPCSACRLLLEVVDVRVERLQKISEQDAVEEGINLKVYDNEIVAENYLTGGQFQDWSEGLDAYRNSDEIGRASFQTLWQSINGPESWYANPWVWVITFKRIEP